MSRKTSAGAALDDAESLLRPRSMYVYLRAAAPFFEEARAARAALRLARLRKAAEEEERAAAARRSGAGAKAQ